MSNTSQQRTGILIFGALSIIGIVAVVAFVLLGGGNDSGDDSAQPATEDPDLSGITMHDPPRPVSDLTLTATDGEPFPFSTLNGQMALVYFGYTNCPDFCPPTLLDFRDIHAGLAEQGVDVSLVFVSVDAARDTPDAMAQYIARYDSDIIGLVAQDESALATISDEFGVTAVLNEADESGYYTVDHTVSKFLLDADGNLIATFSWGLSANTIVDEIVALSG